MQNKPTQISQPLHFRSQKWPHTTQTVDYDGKEISNFPMEGDLEVLTFPKGRLKNAA
jgi:hypothetical protein